MNCIEEQKYLFHPSCFKKNQSTGGGQWRIVWKTWENGLPGTSGLKNSLKSIFQKRPETRWCLNFWSYNRDIWIYLNMIKGLPNCLRMLMDWSRVRRKNQRFMKGLKQEIMGKLISLQLRNYLQAVKKASRSGDGYTRKSIRLGEGTICVEASPISGTIRICGVGIY